MASALPYLSDVLVIFGLFALTVGVYGVIRMPDTYLKLHAASNTVFLGGIPLLLASAVIGNPAIIYRAALVGALLLLTTPIATHAVAKAAYQRGEAPGTADE